jgi:hypothetical protein
MPSIERLVPHEDDKFDPEELAARMEKRKRHIERMSREIEQQMGLAPPSAER